MFTGLIEEVGDVVRIQSAGEQRRLTIRCGVREFVLGESIAVNGSCLTVERSSPGEFTAYASAETMARTTLGRLKPGSRVNLERALALGDRLGGHMVSGHIDCLGKIEKRAEAGESIRFTVSYPASFAPLVVEKGSVALDGISLTVNECGQGWLTVNIIPGTMAETIIPTWKPGVEVNVETDVIGKYVQQMVGPYAPKAPPKKEGGVTMEMLRRNGF
jgi:riboflavin synthase